MSSKPHTKASLTKEALIKEANLFSTIETSHNEPSIFGVSDGKAIGTYFEHKFKAYLTEKYEYLPGNSASGIDFPDLQVDMKVTSVNQPQSSCPFKSARQKIFGLGYSLLIFVYEKVDNNKTRTGTLRILHCIFIEKQNTADYQTTVGLTNLIKNNANSDDLVAFLFERLLPVDEIEANKIAEEILANPPIIGYLTISNALQWRLQYSRVITLAGQVDGLVRVV